MADQILEGQAEEREQVTRHEEEAEANKLRTVKKTTKNKSKLEAQTGRMSRSSSRGYVLCKIERHKAGRYVQKVDKQQHQ